MKIVKKILIVLLFALVVIQFIRPEKNQSAEKTANDIVAMYPPDTETAALLDKACNDCHTNNTKYPWYSNIQPVAWWLADHVKEGKQHLNFSEFGTYRLRKQYHKMEEVIEQVKKGEMPLNSYTWTHGDARLTTEQKVQITGWAQSVMDSMKAVYPIDSLIKKKS